MALHPARLYVVRGGKVIAETPAVEPAITLDGAPEPVNFML